MLVAKWKENDKVMGAQDNHFLVSHDYKEERRPQDLRSHGGCRIIGPKVAKFLDR